MSPDYLQSLLNIPGIRADFIKRLPGIPVDTNRDQAMIHLRESHSQAVQTLGFPENQWWRAEQVHGNRVAIAGEAATIVAADGLPVVPDVDGLIARTPGLLLAIYVADCGAIWLADLKNGAYGLLHSGKKGTEGNILGQAVALMQSEFGSQPSDIIGVLGPCIRPPHYEVDFAATIREQAKGAGLGAFHDCETCTASDLSNYYSYRKELGHTGRMMALIGKLPHS